MRPCEPILCPEVDWIFVPPTAVKCTPNRCGDLIPTPMFGHPTVGGAVARDVANAGERKVITEQQEPVGRRLIKQPPPCHHGLVHLSVVARFLVGMGEADKLVRDSVAGDQGLPTI
jgi:hypothetical protein